jgi:hypothetical protein
MPADDYKKEDMRPWRRCTITALFILTFGLLWYGLYPSADRNWRPGMTQPWQEVAQAKRARELAKIPSEWRLSSEVKESALKRRVIAGEFIESLLDKETLHITRLDPVELMEKTGNGTLSAYDLVKAFSKRAAYGHQIVM